MIVPFAAASIICRPLPVPISMCTGPAALDLAPRALRRLESARQRLVGRPWVLVDANNVLAAAGRVHTVATLTSTLDSWAEESGLQDRLVTVWDVRTATDKHSSPPRATFIIACFFFWQGGLSLPSGFTLPSSAAVFSGSEELADDVIVQAVGLLRGPTVVFTTDQTLRGRCYAQRTLQLEESGAGSSSTSCAEDRELHALHSIYLGWMLAQREPTARQPVEQGHWRAQATGLARALRADARDSLNTDDGDCDRRRLRSFARWFDHDGRPAVARGLSVARRTRHGNTLYAYEHDWDEMCKRM